MDTGNDMTAAPLVLVSARRLDDVCELARGCADRLDQSDPLVSATRGAVAQIRAEAVLEPMIDADVNL